MYYTPASVPKEKLLLTASELSEKVFGGKKFMSHDKLYRLAREGRIPSIKIDGRVFFPLDQIKEWIKTECQVKTPPTLTKKNGSLRIVRE